MRRAVLIFLVNILERHMVTVIVLTYVKGSVKDFSISPPVYIMKCS